MKIINTVFTAVMLLSATAVFSQKSLLTGTWKIDRIDVSFTRSDKDKPAIHPYFNDLYEHKIGLTFGTDGTLNYENMGNPNLVYFTEQNGQLILSYTKDFTKGARETFEYSISGETLTLIKSFPTHTETYTLNK